MYVKELFSGKMQIHKVQENERDNMRFSNTGYTIEKVIETNLLFFKFLLQHILIQLSI